MSRSRRMPMRWVRCWKGIGDGSAQCEHAGRRGREATGVEVERAQLVLEVDVEPFAAGGAALSFDDRQKAAPDARVSPITGHERVDDEGMHPAVPGHVDEP